MFYPFQEGCNGAVFFPKKEVIRGESVCSSKFDHVLSILYHSAGEEVANGVIVDPKFLLNKRDHRGRGIFCRAFMCITCVILVFAFEKAALLGGNMSNTNIWDASAALGVDFFATLGEGEKHSL